MLRYICQFCLAVTLSAMVAAPTLSVAEAPPEPYQVIELTTDRVMTLVNEATAYADEDPERYFRELQLVLDDVVDYSGFSRGVMGEFASRKRYKSLDAEGKKALRRQVERFTEVMRTGLVRTYGKGLLAFGGSKVEIQRPDTLPPNSRQVSITQLIYGDAAEPYVIEYMMRKGKKDGRWRMRNLRVESINLGVIYYNQFQAAAKDAGGDLDAVIDNWSAPPDSI